MESKSYQAESQASTSSTKVMKVNPDIVIPQQCEQESSVMSTIEIPSVSVGEMDFGDFEFSTSDSDHIIDDSSDPLYPGAPLTVFQATSILTFWFSLYPGISKSSFDRLLNILHMHILPVGNNLPESYDDAQKSLRHFLTPVKEYHCCVNDCVIYRNSTSGMYADLDNCPKCKEPRYKHKGGRIPRKRFTHLPLELSKTTLPPAPFRLSKSDCKLANQRALSVRTPHGFDWTSRAIFDDKVHMKSVQWKHILTSGILKYCIRELLGPFQRKTIFELCDVLSLLLSEEVCISELDALEDRVHRVLSLLERDFPVSLHVIVFHLLHHLPMFIRRFGPAYSFWMYPFERFNSWIVRRIHNRRYPEATVVETYRLFEFTQFLHITKQIPLGSTLDFWDVSSEDDQSPADVRLHNSQTTTLDETDLAYLNEYYQCLFGESMEGEKAKDIVQREIFQCRFHTKCDNHSRVITYSPDNPVSKHSSSIVYSQIAASNQILFGKIVKTFMHNFNGRMNRLLYLVWYDCFERDKESNIIVVDTSKQYSCNPFISTDDVSKPLVYACDNDNSKLYVLNCPSSILSNI